jgi:hypothetical protein
MPEQGVKKPWFASFAKEWLLLLQITKSSQKKWNAG